MVVYSGIYVVAAFAFWYTDVAADGTHLVSLYNSFYWCIVTLGTVGYGDIVPTTTQAKNVTMIVIVTQIFLLGFLISAVVSTVTEQAQQQSLGLYGTTLHDHFVVIGDTPVGAAAVCGAVGQGPKGGRGHRQGRDDVPKILARTNRIECSPPMALSRSPQSSSG